MKVVAALAGVYVCSLMAVHAEEVTPNAAIDDEGLVAVQVKGLDHVYARPGVTLSTYNKVMLDPVEVSFRKNWTPDRAGGPITTTERQAIRSGLAKIFRQELTKELQKSGRYTVVTLAASDVLRIKAEIRDLYMNAPGIPRAGATRVYAVSSGEIRLVAELRDAETGYIIARVIDLKRDPDAPWMHITTRVDNVAAARLAIAQWAALLRSELDAAHNLQPASK